MTDLTLPFHTPSVYSGRRIRWKAVLEADNDTEDDDNEDDTSLTSPQRIVKIVAGSISHSPRVDRITRASFRV